MYIKKTHQQYLFIKEKDLKFSTAAWMKLPGKKIMEWRGSRSKNYSFSNSYRNTKPRQRRGFQLVEKVRFLFCASCDSTHKIEFAQQIHKNRGRVPRFLYKGKKCVRRTRFFFSIRSKAWFRSRGCSKNDSFSTASGTPKGVPFPLSPENILSLLTIYHVQFQIFLQISIKILTTTFKVVILIL